MVKPFDYMNDAFLWGYEFSIKLFKNDDDSISLPALGLTEHEKVAVLDSLLYGLYGHKPMRKGVSAANYKELKNKYPDITESELVYYGWLRRIMVNIFFNAIKDAIAENSCFVTLESVIWGLDSLEIFHFTSDEIRTIENIIRIKLKGILPNAYQTESQNNYII